MKAIKFGVCGVGRIGKSHCRFFSQDRERYELVALCDLDLTVVGAMAAEFGGKGYSDFAEFLADPEMEVGSVGIIENYVGILGPTDDGWGPDRVPLPGQGLRLDNDQSRGRLQRLG